MAKFETAKKIEEPSTEIAPIMLPSGWMRAGDVEFKKDKQGRWRERSAGATAPGVYINKERVEAMNLNKTLESVGQPEEIEIIHSETIPTPPPIPERKKKSKASELVAEHVEEIKLREQMRPLARAIEDVKEQTRADVEQYETDVEAAVKQGKKQDEQTKQAKKIEEQRHEEFDLGFLNKIPSKQEQSARETKARKRGKDVETLERDAYKRLTEELSLLWTKKEELDKLLAKKETKNNPYADKQFAAAAELLNTSMLNQDYDGANQALDKSLARMLVIKTSKSEDVDTLREVLTKIKSRLTELETLTGEQNIANAIGEMLITGMKTKFKRETKPIEQPAKKIEGLEELEFPTEVAADPNPYEHLREMPNVEDLRREEMAASARTEKSKAGESAIMRDLMRDARYLQSKIDEQTLLLREEKARAGFWGMIFDKKAKARIKEIEQNLNSMHDQMEKLVGDRDIREVLGEEEIDIAQRRQEPKENNMTLINQASEFGGLYDALKEIGEVERSTGKVDSAEELIKNIEEIRKFYAEQNISTPMPENHIILNQFTRNFGLREKVRELLNKEIVDRATEKKEQMA